MSRRTSRILLYYIICAAPGARSWDSMIGENDFDGPAEAGSSFGNRGATRSGRRRRGPWPAPFVRRAGAMPCSPASSPLGDCFKPYERFTLLDAGYPRMEEGGLALPGRGRVCDFVSRITNGDRRQTVAQIQGLTGAFSSLASRRLAYDAVRLPSRLCFARRQAIPSRFLAPVSKSHGPEVP